jgi:hypothetical protein
MNADRGGELTFKFKWHSSFVHPGVSTCVLCCALRCCAPPLRTLLCSALCSLLCCAENRAENILRLIRGAPDGTFDSALLAYGYNLFSQEALPVLAEVRWLLQPGRSSLSSLASGTSSGNQRQVLDSVLLCCAVLCCAVLCCAVLCSAHG